LINKAHVSEKFSPTKRETRLNLREKKEEK